MRGFKRRIWVLEDDLNLPAQPAQIAAAVMRYDPCRRKRMVAVRRLIETEHDAADRGLATAGFADEAKRLARRNRKRHVIDRAHRCHLAPNRTRRQQL
jgi:hypothetical protein